MNVISEITKQKRGNRLNVFVNGNFFVGVSQDTLAEFNLYKDKEIDTGLLKEIIKFDFFQSMLNKALRLVAASPKTEKTLRFKLKQVIKERAEDYSIEIESDNVLNEVISKLTELGYLNDERYATEFVNARLNNRVRSKDLIKMELLQNGISKEIADTVLSTIKIDEKENAASLLLKKYGSIHIEKGDNKKISFLRGKGYNWDVISKFLKDDFEE